MTGIRRIEVKGRQRGQPIRLTTNEWYKPAQLADSYWLYVVCNPLDPTHELLHIQNPVAALDYPNNEAVTARTFVTPVAPIPGTSDQKGGASDV